MSEQLTQLFRDKDMLSNQINLLIQKQAKNTDDICVVQENNEKLTGQIESILAPKPIAENYVFNGKNNKLFVWDTEKQDYVECYKKIPKLNIIIKGDNNVIKFGNLPIDRSVIFEINGNNNTIVIGHATSDMKYASRIIELAVWMKYDNNELIVGNNCLFSWNNVFSFGEQGCKCIVGDNCRFAENNRIYVSDNHPIVDRTTGRCLNYGNGKRCMTIGNNCWIGLGCFLNKSTKLPDYTIVGAHSVVSREFVEPYTVIAGNPAKVVKNNVKRLDFWEDVLIPDEGIQNS